VLAIGFVIVGLMLAIGLVFVRLAFAFRVLPVRLVAIGRMPVVGVPVARMAVALVLALACFALSTLIGFMPIGAVLAIRSRSVGDIAKGMATMTKTPSFISLFLLQESPVHIILGDDAGLDLLLQGFAFFLFLEVALEPLLFHFFAFAEQEG